MDFLTALFDASPGDPARFRPAGVIVLLVGALLAFPARRWSRGNEKRETAFRAAGLLLAIAGTLLALRFF